MRGGAGAGQMAPPGGAASFPLWLLLRGGGTAVLLLHTVDLIGIVRTARCSCCSTIARPSAFPAWSRFTACEVASALLRWMEHDRCRTRMRSTTFGRAIC